jgi:hypothetical protein
MNAKRILLAALTLLVIPCSTPLLAAEQKPALLVPPATEILARLKHSHPRLIASAEDFARLKAQVASEPVLKDWYDRLRRQGARILDQPPSQYEIPDGLRLLATSRRVLQRVQTLALLYRLEPDPKYLDRTWLELHTAAAFKDWNPRHFLDTAEMTHAFAIGYDWLYDQWTPAQRTTLREAMVEKGIKLANDIQNRNTWWAAARHNWNQVCNGGIGMGALAIGDEVPDVAGPFLAAALKSIQLPMAEFAPDGAWAEGPGYWNYATSYNVVFLAALETALGTDYGLSQMPGFSEAGSFPLYASAPSNRTFNYADAGEGTIRAAQMFWLARKFNRPAYAWYERQLASPQPLDLIWFDPRGEPPTPATLPLDKYFRNAEVVTLRSAWNDPQAVFVGFKAGDNKANHSHLDLGSFVLEALGTRWAIDLGSDNYNMPAYFGKERWTYYRLRAEGHNALLINPGSGPDQDPRAVARIARFDSHPERSFAIADLTPAYASQARRVMRGIALLNHQQVLVQDEIQADQPAEVWWFLHTKTTPEISADGALATLTQGKARLQARILSPAGATFTVRDARPLATSPNPNMQNKNAGVRKLCIQLTGVADARLAVLLSPLRQGEDASTTVPKLIPLANW